MENPAEGTHLIGVAGLKFPPVGLCRIELTGGDELSGSQVGETKSLDVQCKQSGDLWVNLVGQFDPPDCVMRTTRRAISIVL